MKVKLLIVLMTGLISAALIQHQDRTGWRGIVPLKSNRTQVERELGSFDRTCECYATATDVVHVKYATGPCTGDLPGWNVPADTVLSITVSPMKKHLFSDVEPKQDQFVKTVDDTFTTYYGDGTRGLRYSVSTSGFVNEISYVPSIQDNHLRCPGFPPTDGGKTAYVPYQQFSYSTVEDVTSRLGEFAIRLSKSPNYKGYVVVYAGLNKNVAPAAEVQNAVRNYLQKELDLDQKTFQAITGGYREQPTVELFLIPSDWPVPIANPTFGGIPK